MIKIETFVVGPLQTNCYLVYDADQKTGFLIDPGGFSQKILSVIKNENIGIKNIICTHAHPDHTSGNKVFGYPALFHEYDGGSLKDGDIIGEGNVKLQVIHTPGHTPGSMSLKLGNVIFTGDTLFAGGVGRTDLPGGNEKDLLDSIKRRLMTEKDEMDILPGHGPSSTIGYERKNNPFCKI